MGWMSYGSKKFEHLDADMRKLIPPLDEAMEKLIPLIDADTNAFNDYMSAMKLPRKTEEEKKTRSQKMQEGLKKAIDVPLSVMRISDSCWDSMLKLAELGNINSASDLAVGAKCIETGIYGAFKNVEINLPQIEDEKYKKTVLDEGNEILKRAKEKFNEVEKILEGRK
jgi:glutamate formiminotransferase/formiminotetrahydrofolate cyclodeaminase